MRDQLIDTATELFARRGIDGVSISDIATAAGASKANVLHHFGSKDGLYAACLDRINTHLAAAVDRTLASTDPPSALGTELQAWATAHSDDVRIMAYGLLRLPEHDGRWALSEPVTRMIELVGGDTESATTLVVDLLGTVTYREMARPIIETWPAGALTRSSAASTHANREDQR